MTSNTDEKQIAIRLNERLIYSLDELAKNASMTRSHLMLSFVNIWLNVLDESHLPGLFYITSLLRVRESQMNCIPAYEHEFTESRLPEKNLPVKFSESTILVIDGCASINHISRHQLLKTMIIVGIEELQELTDRRPFQLGAVEQELHYQFSNLMKKGFKAFKAYIK